MTIKKPIRVYADTSVFGGAFDKEFAQASSVFLSQVESGAFESVLSPVIEEEMVGAPEEVRNLFQRIAAEAEMIEIKEENLRLHEQYLQAGILSRQWFADALHVAHATVCNCRMIVSWNFRHIVHYDKIALYNAVNVKEGYSPIGIHSPQEVIDYEEKEF